MDVTKKRSQHQIKNGDILLSYIGMLAMGKPQFDAVNEMHDDKEFYKAALGIASDIPSEATLRQRMDDIGDTIRKQIQEENVSMLVSNGIVPNKSADGCVHVDLEVSHHDRCFQNLQRLRRICTHARLYRDARILHQYRTACRITAFPKRHSRIPTGNHRPLQASHGRAAPFPHGFRQGRIPGMGWQNNIAKTSRPRAKGRPFILAATGGIFHIRRKKETIKPFPCVLYMKSSCGKLTNTASTCPDPR